MTDNSNGQHDDNIQISQKDEPSIKTHKPSHLSNEHVPQRKQQQLPSEMDPWNLVERTPPSKNKNQYVQEWLSQQQQQKQQQQQVVEKELNQKQVLVTSQQQLQKHTPIDKIKDQNTPQTAAMNFSKPSEAATLDSVLNLAKYPPPFYANVQTSSVTKNNHESINRDSWLIAFEEERISSQNERSCCQKALQRPHHQQILQKKRTLDNKHSFNFENDTFCSGSTPCLSTSVGGKQLKSKSTGDVAHRGSGCEGKGVLEFDSELMNDLSGKSKGCGQLNKETNKSMELSMLFEHCRYPRCINFVSKFTRPYCHEHVNIEVRQDRDKDEDIQASQASNNSEMFSVMLGTLCRVPGCVNMTSVNVYPFCYEHLDLHADYTGQVRQEFFEQDKSEKFSGTHQEKEKHLQVHTRPTKVDASTMTEESAFPSSRSSPTQHFTFPPSTQMNDLSIMPADPCIVVGCPYYTSCYTHPVCYEHLEHLDAANFHTQPAQDVTNAKNEDPMFRSLLGRDAIHRHADHDDDIKRQDTETLTKAEDDNDIQYRYIEAMKDMEKHVKRIGTPCRSPTCLNYGNQPCAGFCHACYRQIGRG